MGEKIPIESFHWSELKNRCAEIAVERDFKLAESGGRFESEELILTPPLVFPISPRATSDSGSDTTAELAARRANRSRSLATAPNSDLDRFLKSVPLEPGLHCMILLQAGAVSLGMFQAGEVRYTKSMKRYVVRGKGRAQPTYLNTRGKSRYGSRLRLQNARMLFEETNSKLTEFFDEFGEPDLIFASAPVRLWPDLFRAKVPPPFDQEHPIIKVPLDLPVPTTEVLLRTYKSLCYGKLERTV
ncbi:MAG: hypothetical protein ACI8TQ_000783 [Planctomycetota bacterium]|jgi:hypothetical protein